MSNEETNISSRKLVKDWGVTTISPLILEEYVLLYFVSDCKSN